MDIIAEIGNSPLYTLHSHTQFCDGRAPMEDFGRMARDMGFTHYGFTPHSPVPIESPCNMAQADVEAYKQEVKRVQALFPEVKFLTGMEIDYLGPDWGPAIPYFQGLGLDYSIGSVHFIPSQDGEIVDVDGSYASFEEKMATRFHGDIRYVVETFYSQTLAMVEAGGFDIVGHFDKIKHNAGLYHHGLEDEEWYSRLADDLIDAIIAKGLIVEINTKAWREHKQLFPSQRHWRRLLKANVPIVVNSDAHYPKFIDASRREVMHALSYLASRQ